MGSQIRLGAQRRGNDVTFCVWAPNREKVRLKLLEPERWFEMVRAGDGYFAALIKDLPAGTRYQFELDPATLRPDPASRFQPETVHGPSCVVDEVFPWKNNAWAGLPLRDYVIYELHVGAFTAEGSFGAIVPHLKELKELGITALELMPVAQFPGKRNWGYDGVYPFAVQNSYGGPEELKKLIDAAHGEGLAVVMDVVYNHLGPEGNYLRDFGPYFSEQYGTPWGAPLNFDGPHSDHVRRFFTENALMWIEEFRVDALRFDAVHAILDFSAVPFLLEINEAVHALARQLNRIAVTFAESNLNDVRVIRDRARGGWGFDAMWEDDFHHNLHVLLTGEKHGYYMDFGGIDLMKKTLAQGYCYEGQYAPFWKRRHGNSPAGERPERFVFCSQNHDQVGNRLKGDRLTTHIPAPAQKLAAGLTLLAPQTPLLFMGEEYGEKAPFPYFVDHGDAALTEAVRKGRKEEFASFHWTEDPPDPASERTFQAAKLNHALQNEGIHRDLREFYRALLKIRREIFGSQNGAVVSEVLSYNAPDGIELRHQRQDKQWVCVFNMGAQHEIDLPALGPGRWTTRLNSADVNKGRLPPLSLVVYESQ